MSENESGEKSHDRPRPPSRPKRILCDETEQVVVQVLHSTVIFKPGMHLNNAHLIALAAEHNILTREV